ncbi:MAG: hypothetical protein JXA33_08295 [Anaerolineae bacterium]|nr:hypothetical protein [Anaerolineae bacterium]
MNFVPRSQTTERQQEKVMRRVLLSAGTGYGVLFGLVFSGTIWGYEVWVLSRTVDFIWPQLALGTLLAVLIGTVAGILGALSPCNIILPPAFSLPLLRRLLNQVLSWTSLTVIVWTIATGVLSWIAAHIPYEIYDFMVGWADPRFSNVVILPYTHTNHVRTWLITIANLFVGMAIGFVELRVVDWAWDSITPKRRLGVASWVMVGIGAMVAVVPASVINLMIMRPIRIPQQIVAEQVAVTLSGGVEAAVAQGLNKTVADRYGTNFTEPYQIHFVDFHTDTETLYTSSVDVVFETDAAMPFAMRCVVLGTHLSFCDDFSKRLADWMDVIVQSALTGTPQWSMDGMRALNVSEAVLVWLDTHQREFSDNYVLSYVAQRGQWILLSAQFDSGFEMVCRFHGLTPMYVDVCEVPAYWEQSQD